MGVQGIHRRVESEGGVIFPDGLHPLHKVLAAAPLEEGQDGGAQGVVHQAVAVAPQDVLAAHTVGHLGGAVLPHLADDHRVGLFRPGGPMDARHKVVGQLVGHIQPPAVRAGPEPAADHAVLTAEDKVPIGGVIFVHSRQGVDAPPAVVLMGPLGKVEPGAVRGVPALAGSGLGVEAVAVEVAAHKAGVVKHPVQHHPHTQPVGLIAQPGEILVCPQHRVHPAVVGGAVAVIFRRLEDGVEVDGLHPQAPQVAQLPDHTLKIPAEEIPVAHLPLFIGEILRELLPALMDGASPHHALRVGHPAAAEAVGENLIGDPLAKPGGDGIRPIVDGELIGPQLLLAAVQPLQTEGVPYQAHIASGVQGGGKQVLAQVMALPGQLQHKDLIVPALVPDGHTGVRVALNAGRAEGKLYLRPRGHRPVGRLVPRVSGVVGGQIWHWYHSEYQDI